MTQSEKLLRQKGIAGVQVEKYTLQAHITTTDATTTTVMAIPVAEKTVLHLNLMGIGTRDDLTDSLFIFEQNGWRRATSGNVAAFGTANRYESHDSSGSPTVTVNADTANQTIDIDVTGIAAQDWTWYMTVEIAEIILP